MNIVAGTRMLNLEEDLTWKFNGDISGLPIAERTGSSHAKDTQWDAIVGVKGKFTFGADRQWYVPCYLDVGTGESALTWQAMTGLGHSFNSIDCAAVPLALNRNPAQSSCGAGRSA